MDGREIEKIARRAVGCLAIDGRLEDLADDFTQDAALAVVEALARNADTRQLPLIAKRAALKSMRSAAADRGLSDLAQRLRFESTPAPARPKISAMSAANETADQRPTPAEQAELDERLLIAKNALSRLPKEERALVELCIMGGKSQAEAAQILGITQPTACRRLEKAVAAMKAMAGE